jgi:hypothetical protein
LDIFEPFPCRDAVSLDLRIFFSRVDTIAFDLRTCSLSCWTVRSLVWRSFMVEGLGLGGAASSKQIVRLLYHGLLQLPTSSHDLIVRQ